MEEFERGEDWGGGEMNSIWDEFSWRYLRDIQFEMSSGQLDLRRDRKHGCIKLDRVLLKNERRENISLEEMASELRPERI